MTPKWTGPGYKTNLRNWILLKEKPLTFEQYFERTLNDFNYLIFLVRIMIILLHPNTQFYKLEMRLSLMTHSADIT